VIYNITFIIKKNIRIFQGFQLTLGKQKITKNFLLLKCKTINSNFFKKKLENENNIIMNILILINDKMLSIEHII
jgi:hypothetical protein